VHSFNFNTQNPLQIFSFRLLLITFILRQSDKYAQQLAWPTTSNNAGSLCKKQQQRAQKCASLYSTYMFLAIARTGIIRPTVIDKNWPIGLIGSRLRDEKYEVVESADFHIQLLIHPIFGVKSLKIR